MNLRSVSLLVDAILISLIPYLREDNDDALRKRLELAIGDQSPYTTDMLECCAVLRTGIDLLRLSERELLRYSQIHSGVESSVLRTDALLNAFATQELVSNP
jgi:hypothetical protein